jgi:hypothetical protein
MYNYLLIYISAGKQVLVYLLCNRNGASYLPASTLVLPHPPTTYPTLRRNQASVSTIRLLPSDGNVCILNMDDYATTFLQECQAVTGSSKVILQWTDNLKIIVHGNWEVLILLSFFVTWFTRWDRFTVLQTTEGNHLVRRNTWTNVPSLRKSSLNLGPDISYPEWGFPFFISVPPDESKCNTSNWATTASLYIL